LKKSFTIFLLFFYLISFTELKEFFKFPILIEHYFEHQVSNKNLTLLNFLANHYSKDTSKFPDFKKDMKLPFKSHENCIGSSIIGYFPHHLFSIDFNLNNCVENVSPSIFNEIIYSSSFLSTIWQPPKL